MFKFKINGTDINDQPSGWDGIKSSIKRDEATGILLYDCTIDLKFYAGQDGHTLLKSAWDADHYGESIIDIYQRYPDGQYRMVFSGTIFHSSIKLELINQNLSFKTEDRGFYAMINNNKKIDTDLNGGKTKNDISIPVCPSFTLNVHRIDNGNLRHQCQAYKLIDVIKYLVTFMTDNRMTVEAPCFDVGGEFENICIVGGHELAKHNQTRHPKLSWETLSVDLVKRLNVQFSIIGDLDNPVMKIETHDAFYNSSVSMSIPTIPDEVKLEIDENLLYSCVEVGSNKTDTTSTLVFPDVYDLTSFRTLSWHFKGTNNIDRKLDLVGKLVVSHACIEVVTENKSGFDSYYDDVFMIEYKLSNDWTWDVNWVGSVVGNKHLFNEMFTNQNILSRWAGSLPNDISNTTFTPSANMFQANIWGPSGVNPYALANISTIIHTEAGTVGSGPMVFDAIPFWNDFSSSNGLGYDPSNNYGGGNLITPQGNTVQFPNLYFKAPANGYYTFYANIDATITLSNNFAGTHTIANRDWTNKNTIIMFRKFDLSNTQIDYKYGTFFPIFGSWGTIFQPINLITRRKNYVVTWGTFMNAGEKVDCVMGSWTTGNTNKNDAKEYYITATNGYFGCNGIDTGGGLLTPSNPYDYKSMKITFNYPLNLNNYETLRNSKQGLIEVPVESGKYLKGWINNVGFEHNSGETKFILKTDGNTVYR